MDDVLVIYQAFPPDPAAGGQCVADVCEALASQGVRVRVIAADRGYDDPSQRFAAREKMRGFEVRRVGLASFGKSSLFVRLAGALGFVVGAIARGITGPRPSVVVAGNSPPMGGLAGLVIAAWHRRPFVYWLMDLNPDAAIAIGLVSPKALSVRVFDSLNRRILRRAHTIVVMDDAMKRRMLAKGPARAHIVVVPPWGGPMSPDPAGSPRNAFRRGLGLSDEFIVMYSGNHNLAHPLTTVLDAAQVLQDDPRFVFLFVGGGRGKEEVDARGLANVRSLPYQPREAIADSLGAADVHVVVMGNDLVGIVHPSKVYGVLAIGRPVLYVGPANSHVAAMVEQHDLGASVRHGDVGGVVDALRAFAAATGETRAQMGTRGRRLVEQVYPPDRLKQQVATLVLGAARG